MTAAPSALESALRRHPFVHGLADKHVKTLATCATEKRFQKGEYLWRQGDAADVFFLIRDGEISLGIAVPGEGPLHVESVSEGEVLGLSWMLPPYRWHFDARAVETVRGFAFDAARLREHCKMDTQLHYELLVRLMPVISGRLDATRRKLIDLHMT
jgi:CRP-like cAMP-binding protein